MNKKKELAKNTIIILVGKICTQFVSFFLLPLYTSLLTAADYGIVDLLNTYINLLVPVVTLQLEMAAFRFLVDARDDIEQKKIIISNTFLSIGIQCVIYIIIYLSICPFLNISHKYFLTTNVIASILSSLVLQIARGLGDNKTYSIGSCVAAVLTVILNVLLVSGFKLGANGMLVANFSANIICFIYVFISLKLFKFISFKYRSVNKIKDLLKYSIPLIPNNVSWWIVDVSDRTIITNTIGIAANGIYAVSNKFSNLFMSIISIFNLSWTESASMHINDEDRDQFFSETITTMFKFFSSLCIGLIAVIPFMYDIIINEQYSEAYQYIPILLAASIFNVVISLYSVIYIAKKMTNQVAKTSIVAAIINILLNIVLIKYIGLYAAAISTAVSYFVMMLYRYFDVKKYVNVKISKNTIVSTVILFAISTYCYYQNHLLIKLLNFFIVILYITIVNRRILTSIIVQLKEKIIYKLK